MTNSQKAVIASEYAKTKKVDIAEELGADKYIKKPYTLEKLAVFDLHLNADSPIQRASWAFRANSLTYICQC